MLKRNAIDYIILLAGCGSDWLINRHNARMKKKEDFARHVTVQLVYWTTLLSAELVSESCRRQTAHSEPTSRRSGVSLIKKESFEHAVVL